MIKIRNEETLVFDDVMLQPQYSTVKSRSEVDVSVKLTKGIELKFPIVPSNMQTITGYDMAEEIYKLGGMAILHRFMSIDDQIDIVRTFKNRYFNDPNLFNHVGVSIGVKEEDRKNLKKFVELGVKIVCIDVAHGDSIYCVEMTKYVSETYPHIFLISGNVATYDGTMHLLEAGADVIKVGIGNGCFAAGTRILMSNGHYKNIEDVVPGDRVINKDGNPVKVLDSFCTGIKKVSKLRTNLFYEDTYVTSDHKYWVGDLNTISDKNFNSCGYAKNLDKMAKTLPKSSKYKWKKISDTNKDLLLFPKDIKFELPETFKISLMKRSGGNTKTCRYEEDYLLTPSYELGYIFGTFLGDGHAACNVIRNNSHIGSVRWYFGKMELNITKKLIKCLNYVFPKNNVSVKEKSNIQQIFLFYKPFADYLNKFGKQENKKLLPELLVNNKAYLTGLYDGLMDSDGHYDKDGRKTLGNTSKNIIELFNIICINLFGSLPNGSKRAPSTGGLKNCNIDNCKISYQSRILKRSDWRLTKNYQIARILEYENTDLYLPVYDLTVDCDTHSFIADNSIVHNSICTTRIESANGIPLLTSLIDAAQAKKDFENRNNKKIFIMSDGGCKIVGDVVKSLCFADLCMAGNLFAGALETPGTILTIEGQNYKEYVGSSTHRGIRTEGVASLVKAKGPAKDIIQKITDGLQSGCSYQGAFNLKELKEKASFVRITSSGLKESHAHDLDKIIK